MLQGLPLPGALSAAQLDSIARRVAAQRSSIAAMQAQLAAFDEQLAVLEGILGPLTEWGKTWARFERLVLPARGDPAAEGSREPGPGGVIHFSTLTSVHSCGSADQRVYTDNPQDYPQDATLAGPGLA